MSKAKEIEPRLPVEIMRMINEEYVSRRQWYKENEGIECYVTPRTLMAIIRMSIGLAKFRLSDTVIEWDVQEALRLIESSREALDGTVKRKVNKKGNITDKILQLIADNQGE